MRYFEKESGAQAELYKAIKPIVDKAYNMRNFNDVREFTSLNKKTMFNKLVQKDIMDVLDTFGKKEIVTGKNPLTNLAESVGGALKGVEAMPGITGSAAYMRNRSRTYPQLKDILKG